MARQARAFIPGLLQLVVHRAAPGSQFGQVDDDLARLFESISVQTRARAIPVHAYGLSVDRLMLVTAAPSAAALSGAMQSIARSHADHLERQYAVPRPVFDGRFRSALLEPGEVTIEAMLFVEQSVDIMPPVGAESGVCPVSSSRHHIGLERVPLLVDPIEYWNLGNTPFDRQEAWRGRAATSMAKSRRTDIETALRGGWWLGRGMPPDSGARALTPGLRGRPRKAVPN